MSDSKQQALDELKSLTTGLGGDPLQNAINGLQVHLNEGNEDAIDASLAEVNKQCFGLYGQPEHAIEKAVAKLEAVLAVKSQPVKADS